MDSKLPLSEYIKMDHWPEISTALAKKYADYESGTYGVEIEFDPLVMNGMSQTEYLIDKLKPSQLRSAIGRDRNFDNAYESWLEDQRKDANRYSRWKWDDRYGPPDIWEWERLNPEPSDKASEEHDQWMDQYREAESEYANWDRRDRSDYEEEFVESLGIDVFDYIDGGTVERLAAELGANARKRNTETAIEQVSQWLQSQGERLNTSGTGTKDSWNVGPDGMYVEVRSKHLVLSEFSFIEELIHFVQSRYIVSADNSAHVHVGMPKDFDQFDLFVMTTLVDEKAVSQSVSSGRREKFEEWAGLRVEVERKLDRILKETLPAELKVHPSFMDHLEGKKFKISREVFDRMMNSLATKFTGTNIEAFKRHHTVEFRYFASEMKNPRNLYTWIRYFMMLPVIAKKRNHAKLGRYEFIRGDQYITLVVRGKK